MPAYKVEEGVRTTTDDSAVGFVTHRYRKIYWVVRDGVRLLPPYDSSEAALKAQLQLKDADAKEMARP